MKTDRNTLYKATYQYLLDHTFIHDGKKVVSFVLPKPNQFKKKVLAREKGYKRQDLETLDVTFLDLVKDIKDQANQKMKISAAKQSEHQKRINRLKKEGSLKIRLMIKARDWLTYRINRWE